MKTLNDKISFSANVVHQESNINSKTEPPKLRGEKSGHNILNYEMAWKVHHEYHSLTCEITEYFAVSSIKCPITSEHVVTDVRQTRKKVLQTVSWNTNALCQMLVWNTNHILCQMFVRKTRHILCQMLAWVTNHILCQTYVWNKNHILYQMFVRNTNHIPCKMLVWTTNHVLCQMSVWNTNHVV